MTIYFQNAMLFSIIKLCVKQLFLCKLCVKQLFQLFLCTTIPSVPVTYATQFNAKYLAIKDDSNFVRFLLSQTFNTGRCKLTRKFLSSIDRIYTYIYIVNHIKNLEFSRYVNTEYKYFHSYTHSSLRSTNNPFTFIAKFNIRRTIN